MELKILDFDFSVCQVADFSHVRLNSPFCFIEKTDEEASLVCLTEDVPPNTLKREDGWKGFRIQGVLDFSMVGILSAITSILAQNAIPIFAVSTYNTDYLFTKSAYFSFAMDKLQKAGYTVIR